MKTRIEEVADEISSDMNDLIAIDREYESDEIDATEYTYKMLKIFRKYRDVDKYLRR